MPLTAISQRVRSLSDLGRIYYGGGKGVSVGEECTQAAEEFPAFYLFALKLTAVFSPSSSAGKLCPPFLSRGSFSPWLGDGTGIHSIIRSARAKRFTGRGRYTRTCGRMKAVDLLKRLLRGLFTRLYKVEVAGLEHFVDAGERLLIVANHTSFLDAPLLWAFLPGELTFAINSHIAKVLWLRPFLRFVRVFPMDPTNPLSSKALTRYLQQNRKAVIFPEGRITVTGALMKIYDGSGMVADKANARVLPVRIEGAQYTPFSRLIGQVRRRWFPHIRLNVLPARSISAPPQVLGRDRRRHAGRVLTDIMTEMMFSTSDYRRSIFAALLDARRLNGGRHRIAEDIQRQPLNYSQLIRRSLVLGELLAHRTRSGERVGVLLPNSVAAIATFMGLLAYRRVPAMLNLTVGSSALLCACETAQLRTVISAQRFVAAANLQDAIGRLSDTLDVVYLEDLSREAGFLDKLKGVWRSCFARWWYEGQTERTSPEDPAVVLFTSGSEGLPKGVVLSHANLLANREQLAARFDFNAQDVILNALPLFHSFGLSAGALLPLLSGMRVFFYPSPLHYRIVPEVAYAINATIVFGTNTFLAGYARHAPPYDFYSARYVFAGAECFCRGGEIAGRDASHLGQQVRGPDLGGLRGYRDQSGLGRQYPHGTSGRHRGTFASRSAAPARIRARGR